MDLGKAAINLLVATSGATARRPVAIAHDRHPILRFQADLHNAAGAAIALISVGLARTYLDSPTNLP